MTQTKVTDCMTPDTWNVMLYNKREFKKLATQVKQTEPIAAEGTALGWINLVTINSVNDMLYVIKLLGCVAATVPKRILNCDLHDYIFMRQGIDPMWEDVKNENGGTFTIKIAHEHGYDLWKLIMLSIVGETFCDDMQYINGVSISYITDYHDKKNSNTYIKIWDGFQGRTLEGFCEILPKYIMECLNQTDASLRYYFNRDKQDYNKNILSNMEQNRRKHAKQGGFGAAKPRYNNYNRANKY